MERPWGSVTMDFVTLFLNSQGAMTVVMVIDMLTKMAHFVLCIGLPMTQETVRLSHLLATRPTCVRPRYPVHGLVLVGALGTYTGAGMSLILASSRDGQRHGMDECHARAVFALLCEFDNWNLNLTIGICCRWQSLHTTMPSMLRLACLHSW